ncbi:MAG TPA: sporulation membrane protein YtaF [Bacillota bacterium]|jgi:putative sporulation protein YtaF|nr:sporulation membrane protein YtaF [Bacillota bacterium]HOL09208.1 sporulation membrane protein YtaF [Bacillota bacterium]HPO97032.1 sporulation membrane protein YtaF [Bacillota bacterium]
MFTIILLAFSLSLDAFTVGMVYALKGIQIPFYSKLSICFFSIIYSLFALIIGRSLTNLINPYFAKLTGVALLCLMGAGIIIQALVKEDNSRLTIDQYPLPEEKTLFKIGIKRLGITIKIIRDPLLFDVDRSGSIDSFESLMLGLALSLDAIGVSFGSAMIGFRSFSIPLLIGIFQLLFLNLGTTLAQKINLQNRLSQQLLSMLPGFLLIVLALLKL